MISPRVLADASKILTLDDVAQAIAARRDRGRIVLCHGVFDLLHIGHIRHFEQARALGGTLVVTVTPDRFVNKGPGRPVFNEKLRAEAIAALQCVDFVAINDSPLADRPLRAIRPDVYVKGGEYRDAAGDVTGGITAERAVVEEIGAELRFTDDITFSSSNLINRHLSSLPEPTQQWLEGFRQRVDIEAIRKTVESFAGLKVLTIGEAIIDEYQYCETIGKSSKEPMLAVKPTSIETFAGGILAVANHVAGFTEDVALCTVLGEHRDFEPFIRENLSEHVATRFCRRSDGPTIVKRRFIDSYFFHKLFEVYDMVDTPLNRADDAAFCAELEALLPQFDVTIVVDFGHNMLSPRAIDTICRKAEYLAVNAQSNAGNVGYHTISKYPRADFISLAENEMRLEARDRSGDLKPMLRDVTARLGARRIAVTRGSQGCLGFDATDGFATVPSLTSNVKDRMGAGDTFLSVAALAAARGASMELVGFLGNAAGAHAVAQVGHRAALQRVPLLKHVQHLLK